MKIKKKKDLDEKEKRDREIYNKKEEYERKKREIVELRKAGKITKD